MAHRAPSITTWGVQPDGGVFVAWEVDTFFADSEAPDSIVVEYNNAQKQLDKDDRSITITHAELGSISAVTVTVVFKWDGDPYPYPDSVTVQLAASGGQTSASLPSPPKIGVDAIETQTLQHPNRITISWSSSSYTDGQVIWGKAKSSKVTFNFKPWYKATKPMYTGQFTTNLPLAPRALYEFTVQVRNTLVADVWVPSSITVRSAANFTSVKAFLQGSGAPTSGSLLAAIGHGGSLRAMMGV